MKSTLPYTLMSCLCLGLAACNGASSNATPESLPGDEAPALEGSLMLDGSSTVFPISEAMAEEFERAYPGVQVSIGISGSGGGFRKFCADETDISGASRPISEEEMALCAENGVEYIELPVAFDGLSVVVSQDNDFVQCLNLEQMATLWAPESQGVITRWNQLDPSFPDMPIRLYAPGIDSGTYDYFMEAVGLEGDSRGDFTASEDDNILVRGVATDASAISFFGYSYYVENQDTLKLVEIDGGQGCVAPSLEAIADGSYQPLSRPQFIYVKQSALDNPVVSAFVAFYLSAENAYLIEDVGYIRLPETLTEQVKSRYEAGKVGTVFGGTMPIGLSLDQIYDEG